jgi:hypothetical protein
MWSPDRSFRVLVSESDLVFVRLRSVNSFVRTMSAQGGLFGALFFGSIRKNIDTRIRAEVEQVDKVDVRTLLSRDPANFSVRLFEVRTSVVTGRALFPTHGLHLARWMLEVTDGRKMAMQLEHSLDVRTALDLLAERLGDRHRADVVWDAGGQRVRKAMTGKR